MTVCLFCFIRLTEENKKTSNDLIMCQDSKVKSSPNVRHKHVLFDVNIQKHIPDIRLDKFIGQKT